MPKTHIASILFTLTLALVVSASFPDRAHAATYKCTENGKVSYSDKPCKNTDFKAVDSNVRSNGMHSSWFATPAYSKHQARCTEAACVCGTVESKIKDKGMAVLNAMSALPSAWANHHSTHKRFKELGLDKKRYPSYIDRLDSISCRIRINQKIVQKYYQDYSADINEEFFLTDKAVEARKADCDARLAGLRQQEDMTEAMRQMRKECSGKQYNDMIRSRKRSLPQVRLLKDSLETLKMSRSAYIRQRNAKNR